MKTYPTIFLFLVSITLCSCLQKETAIQNTISLLLLHQEQNLENIPVSQVCNLDMGEQPHDEVNTQKTISYQEMLEQVFSHDLSVVI